MELDGQFEVVAEASDGREAIAAADAHQPELVVLDLMMPGGMSGEKALRLIRTVAPGAAIVLLTAVDRRDVSDDDLRETLGYLDKTLDLDALVRRLAGMLERAA